jgi:hypothetical protein
MCSLDSVAATIPATAARGRRGSNSSLTAADPEDADDGRSEEADGEKEREGNVGLELATEATLGFDVAPVKDVSTAVTSEVDEKTEGDEPADGEENVPWPVDEAACEWDQEDDGRDDGNGSNDDGVDKATKSWSVLIGLVENPASDAGNNASKGQLGRSENNIKNA